MIILGIDPGYAIIGYGLLSYNGNKFSVLDYGAITTPADIPFNKRLDIIFNDLNLLIKQYKPYVLKNCFLILIRKPVLMLHRQGV